MLSFGELAKLAIKAASLSATGFYQDTPKIIGTAPPWPPLLLLLVRRGGGGRGRHLTGETACCGPTWCRIAAPRSTRRSTSGRSGRLRAGAGLVHLRGAVVGQTGPTAHRRAVDLQDPGSRDAPPVFNVKLLDNAPSREATIFRSRRSASRHCCPQRRCGRRSRMPSRRSASQDRCAARCAGDPERVNSRQSLYTEN